jgi:hypothetical protein
MLSRDFTRVGTHMLCAWNGLYLLLPPKNNNNNSHDVLRSAVGGFVSASTLYPLDVVKTRMQAGHRGTYTEIAQHVAKENGVIGLWKGFQYVGFSSAYECPRRTSYRMWLLGHGMRMPVHCIAVGTNTQCTYTWDRGTRTCWFRYEKLCYFYVYSFCLDIYNRRCGAIGTAANLALGYCVDWAHKPITYPVDTITNMIKVRFLATPLALTFPSHSFSQPFSQASATHLPLGLWILP